MRGEYTEKSRVEIIKTEIMQIMDEFDQGRYPELEPSRTNMISWIMTRVPHEHKVVVSEGQVVSALRELGVE